MYKKAFLFYQAFRRYFFYRKSQFWTKKQIEDYHDLQLKKIVRHAGMHVPYYRQMFKELGLDINKFKGIEDIEKIPFLDKETIRTRSKDFIADNARKFFPVWDKTSGSTGTPLKVLLDYTSIADKYAAVMRAYLWAGYRPGMNIFTLKGMSNTSQIIKFDTFKRTLRFNATKITEKNCCAVNRLLQQKQPFFFVGNARAMIDFYKVLDNSNNKIVRPAGIFCLGEKLTPDMRKFIETSYCTKAFDFYGNVENSAMICEMADNRKYISEDFFFPEIFGDNGKVIKEGYGELVSTSFHNYAMPFIRYKTRDKIKLGRLRQSSPYAFLPVDEIDGRIDNYIQIANGRKVYVSPNLIIDLLIGEKVSAFQFVQDRIDHVIVNLCVEKEFNYLNVKKIKNYFSKQLEEYVSLDVNIVDQLERNNSGKTPFILSKLNY